MARVDEDTLTYTDTELEPSTSYVYQVQAEGATGPGAHQTAAVHIKTPALPENPDTTPPTAPEDLTGTASPGRVDLEWGEALDDTDVSAYVIRRNEHVLAIVDSGTWTYADTEVKAGRQYVYTVETVDVVGHHSQPTDPFAVTAVDEMGGAAPTQSQTLAATGGAALTQSQTLAANRDSGSIGLSAEIEALSVSDRYGEPECDR